MHQSCFELHLQEIIVWIWLSTVYMTDVLMFWWCALIILPLQTQLCFAEHALSSNPPDFLFEVITFPSVNLTTPRFCSSFPSSANNLSVSTSTVTPVYSNICSESLADSLFSSKSRHVIFFVTTTHSMEAVSERQSAVKGHGWKTPEGTQIMPVVWSYASSSSMVLYSVYPEGSAGIFY